MLPSQLLACTWEQLSVSVTCGPLPAVARSSRTVSHAQRVASYNELHHGGPSMQFNVLIFLQGPQWCKTCFIALYGLTACEMFQVGADYAGVAADQ